MDLQRAFRDPHSPAYWCWLATYGTVEVRSFGETVHPLPPPELVRRNIGGSGSAGDFRDSGLVDWRATIDALVRGGFDFDAGGRLFELGCGCGRILRHFAWYADRCELTGADVDADAVRWCAEHLEFATFHTLAPDPPTGLPGAAFDGIYAWSVFSHLPEDRLRAWLDELARLASPGACVVLTVQGRRVIERVLEQTNDGGQPPPDRLRADLPELERTGYLFYSYAALAGASDHHPSDEPYGSTFLLEPYLREHFTRGFDLVEIREAPNEWQDYVILRAR